jgi:hypothetical protein
LPSGLDKAGMIGEAESGGGFGLKLFGFIPSEPSSLEVRKLK